MFDIIVYDIHDMNQDTPKEYTASAGSRTRIDCLEGNHANRYTTDASYQNQMHFLKHL